MTSADGLISTSEIRELLGHRTTSSTRSWIRYRKLAAVSGVDPLPAQNRSIGTAEKHYRRADVDEARRTMTRGLYRKGRAK